ncbi:hypothetical protein E1262_07235 [Jiangella aurantiaca]|uniref:Resolvase HTH domain-containing protein n=1 Tax=Jiangella aurantiaca TaxID=2530373 RepID=A0A4R5AHJ3_9ACTN|nr:hypothetical protein [Jiangella aurantiaca]TDD70920.1 hypothetical protein E1262_07235 [Jiangella aurantiaca]
MVERLIDDAELAARVHAMRAAGKTYDEIRWELHIGASTISRILGVAGRRPARPRVSDGVREKARALRSDGWSVPEIARELGLAKSTAYVITKDVPWTLSEDRAERRAAAARAGWRREKARRQAERERVTGEIGESFGELTDRELLIAGVVAYWAEGAKAKPWNPREELRFINSDPDMIRLYLSWLDLLGIDRTRLKYRINIHESADVPAAEAYWADVAEVPVEQFYQATLKKHNPKTVRKNTGQDYRGCLVITVAKSSPEYRIMDGMWSAVARAVRSRR